MSDDYLTIDICECESKYSIEGNTLYFGRCGHRHGYDLAKISEVSFNCELQELVRLLNRPETTPPTS